jgi:hypothetical protein
MKVVYRWFQWLYRFQQCCFIANGPAGIGKVKQFKFSGFCFFQTAWTIFSSILTNRLRTPAETLYHRPTEETNESSSLLFLLKSISPTLFNRASW